MKSLSRINCSIVDSRDLNSAKEQYDILITAYAQTEIEIWGENYVRVSKQEYSDLIERETVFTAIFNDEVAGTIMLSRHNTTTFSFGLLAVDFSKKGLGIGRKLIQHVERRAIQLGGREMKLEILRPKYESVPFKEHLAKWYERQGYIFTHSADFLELKPSKIEKAKMLVTPAVFDCYSKTLSHH